MSRECADVIRAFLRATCRPEKAATRRRTPGSGRLLRDQIVFLQQLDEGRVEHGRVLEHEPMADAFSIRR